jgi:probable rRNA maturation factor
MALNSSATVVCQSRTYDVKVPRVLQLVELISMHLGVENYQLSISFVGSRAIRQLNYNFRGKDKPTDVLSFPQIEWPKPRPLKRKLPNIARSRPASEPVIAPSVLGDVVISIPEAAANAQRIGQSLPREICFLLVHGMLHLSGYDHEIPADEKRMRNAQRVLMQALGEGRKTPLWANCIKPKHSSRKRAS